MSLGSINVRSRKFLDHPEPHWGARIVLLVLVLVLVWATICWCLGRDPLGLAEVQRGAIE